MIDIDVTLKAKNSSGEQRLHLTHDNGEFWFTLCGKYNGEHIQIDFETMTTSELRGVETQINLILEEASKAKS